MIRFNEQIEHYDSVLVVAIYDGKLVYVKNKKRKWELTGGHKEQNETIFETAKREAFEEGGIVIDNNDFKVLGYYRLNDGHTTIITSARVKDVFEIPETSETVERMFCAKRLSKALLSFPDDIYDTILDYMGWQDAE